MLPNATAVVAHTVFNKTVKDPNLAVRGLYYHFRWFWGNPEVLKVYYLMKSLSYVVIATVRLELLTLYEWCESELSMCFCRLQRLCFAPYREAK